MGDRERLLALARGELGTREAPMGSNRVKYNTDYYGMEVRGDAYPWCCVFQWWLFRRAGLAQSFYGGGKTASCTALYRFYQQRGQEVDPKEVRPGDLVFFVFDGGKSGGMNHVGLCEAVEDGLVVTIDGNTGSSEANGGTVARRRRALKYVGGAARPAYREEEEMKIYRYVSEVPQWARASAEKAVRNGYIRLDAAGAAALYESSLQPLVWLDRAGLLDTPAREA